MQPSWASRSRASDGIRAALDRGGGCAVPRAPGCGLGLAAEPPKEEEGEGLQGGRTLQAGREVRASAPRESQTPRAEYARVRLDRAPLRGGWEGFRGLRPEPHTRRLQAVLVLRVREMRDH